MRGQHILRHSVGLCALTLLSAAPACLMGQTRTDIILGRVVSDSGRPITGAQVIATRAPDRAVFRTSTDPQGQYRIAIADGTGDYLVHVSLPSPPGWSTFRKRVTRAAPSDSTFTVDAVLRPSAAPQQLDAMRVVAAKPTVSRSEPMIGITPVGGGEQFATGVDAILGPDQRGDLIATMLAIPGVSAIGGGFSVLGASPDQNRTTLNGMSFNGGTVPASARTVASLATSPFDPARGWFSGGEVGVTLAAGSIFSTRNASLVLDAPPLQARNAVSRELGQEFTTLRGGFGGSGHVADDAIAYNYGVEARRASFEGTSLATAAYPVLLKAGVAPDSVNRLLGFLSRVGIPTSTSAIPRSNVSQEASLLARFNTPLTDAKTFKSARQSLGLIVYGAHRNSGGPSSSPLRSAASSAMSTSENATVQALYSNFVHPDFLQDVKFSVNTSRSETSPYLALPGGSVLVGTSLPDGTAGLRSLVFGGGSGASRRLATTVELQSDSRFFAPSRPAHAIKVSANVRYDALTNAIAGNQNGFFAFNSLADVVANRPASYRRTLNSPDRTAGEWNAFASLGDQWTVNRQLQFLYGVRAEGNRFTHAPADNPAVRATLGDRTDVVPNRIHISPRLGFTWRYNKAQEYPGYSTRTWGTFPSPLTGVFRGGIGEFRSMMPPDLLSEAAAHTGLPGTTRQLTCVGDAVPTPDWVSYLAAPETIPRDCASGGTPFLFRDAAPVIQLIDPHFDARRSWRSSLSWISIIGGATVDVYAAYSLNLNQGGWVDLNFAGTPKFTLANEGRPVFVESSRIVPSTGLMSGAGARRDTTFGRVVSQRSDLRGDARQVSVSIAEIRPWASVSINYTLQSERSRQRGFEGSTFASPSEAGWARGDYDVRHRVQLQLGKAWHALDLTLVGRVQSGMPYTPMVNGDANGDGLANDRAFILDPAHVADTSLARDLRALFSGAPSHVRACLQRQLGRPAARNSCEGPWTAGLNAQLGLNSRVLPPRLRGMRVSLFLTNPLGGLDQLLHGENTRGWGTSVSPDPVLLQVVGFDPQAMQLKYAANPRFGIARPSNTTVRAPFRITLSVRADLSTPVGEQEIDRFLRPGRAGHPGTKLTVEELKTRYKRYTVDPYDEILRISDSLLLSREQVIALGEARARLAVRTDSALTGLARFLAAVPDEFDPVSTLARQQDWMDVLWDLPRLDVQDVLPKVLTPIQLQLVQGFARFYLNAKEPLKRPRAR